MNEFIDILAVKLGIAVSELIGYYAMRAPWEWADAVISIIGCIILTLGAVRFGKAVSSSTTEWQRSACVVTCGILGFVAFILFIVAGVDLSQAIKAIAAPEAYAIDQLLGRLNGGY